MVNDVEYKRQFQLIDNILPQELEDRKIVLHSLLSNALTIELPLYSPEMISLVNLLNNIAKNVSVKQNDLILPNNKINNVKITTDAENSDDVTTDYNIDVTKKSQEVKRYYLLEIYLDYVINIYL